MWQLYRVHKSGIRVQFESATCQACACPLALILPMVLSLVLSLPVVCPPEASNVWASTTSSRRRDLSLASSPILSPKGQACYSHGPIHTCARSSAEPLQVQVQI